MPEILAVPLPLSTKVTPFGKEPVSESAGFGTPLVVTVNVPADPTVKVAPLADVMAGAAFTVRMKDWLRWG